MPSEWKDIKSLLWKVGGLLASNSALKKEIVGAIQKSLGVSIPEDSVTIKQKTAFIRAHPAIKNEVAMRKEKVLSTLRERGFGRRVVDIR